MSGPVLRILGQVAVAAVGIFGRAFVSAYQQAVQNAKSGKGTAQAAAQSAGVIKNAMNLNQACGILNIVEAEATPAIVKKQYDKYYASNAVDKGGSFYIQSKVYRANELLDMHFKEMEKLAAERMHKK